MLPRFLGSLRFIVEKRKGKTELESRDDRKILNSGTKFKVLSKKGKYECIFKKISCRNSRMNNTPKM